MLRGHGAGRAVPARLRRATRGGQPALRHGLPARGSRRRHGRQGPRSGRGDAGRGDAKNLLGQPGSLLRATAAMTTPSTSPRDAYQEQGFYLHPEPIVPTSLVARARERLGAVVNEEYDTRVPPWRRWNVGDSRRMQKIDQV